MTAEDREPKGRKTTQPSEQSTNMEHDQREALNVLIGKRVIHLLGEPDGLHKVQVRPLWESYYRVNILTGPNVTSVKVANSYFLKADNKGNIVDSTPRITKQY